MCSRRGGEEQGGGDNDHSIHHEKLVDFENADEGQSLGKVKVILEREYAALKGYFIYLTRSSEYHVLVNQYENAADSNSASNQSFSQGQQIGDTLCRVIREMKGKSDQISLLSDAMDGGVRSLPIAQRKPVYPRHGVRSAKKASPGMSSSASLALLKASTNYLYKLKSGNKDL